MRKRGIQRGAEGAEIRQRGMENRQKAVETVQRKQMIKVQPEWLQTSVIQNREKGAQRARAEANAFKKRLEQHLFLDELNLERQERIAEDKREKLKQNVKRHLDESLARSRLNEEILSKRATAMIIAGPPNASSVNVEDRDPLTGVVYTYPIGSLHRVRRPDGDTNHIMS